MTAANYRVIGIESSPYAVKVRAVLRYRRLPYVWVARMPQFYAETAAVRPLIMPVVQFPDGSYRTDSTPIIHDLERRHDDDRSVIPEPPGDDFICDLIEDMADEWLTKCVFNYRFSRAQDARSGASWVIDDAHPELSAAALDEKVDAFIARQTARMPIVGCTPENTPLLERFYEALLDVLEPFVATDRFLFGSRPSLADFALYGQLNTLGDDPTPREILRHRAPRTARWTGRLDDASGVEGDWDEATSPAVRGLLDLAGRYYLPFLAANRQAIDAGEANVALQIDDLPYRQPVFRYQRKCYEFLLHRYAALDALARERIDPLLRDSGCAPFLDLP